MFMLLQLPDTYVYVYACICVYIYIYIYMNVQNMAPIFPYKTTVPQHDVEHSKSYVSRFLISERLWELWEVLGSSGEALGELWGRSWGALGELWGVKTNKNNVFFIVLFEKAWKHLVKPKKSKDEPIKPCKNRNKPTKTRISTHYSQHGHKL